MKKNNADPDMMFRLLAEEFNEVIQVLEQPDLLGHELADLIWFTLTIAELNGIDMETKFKEKAKRNEAKYPEEYFQTGSYRKMRAKAIAMWEEKGGDKAFFGNDSLASVGTE